MARGTQKGLEEHKNVLLGPFSMNRQMAPRNTYGGHKEHILGKKRVKLPDCLAGPPLKFGHPPKSILWMFQMILSLEKNFGLVKFFIFFYFSLLLFFIIIIFFRANKLLPVLLNLWARASGGPSGYSK